MHSDDGGASWIAVRTGLLDDIRTIDAISPTSVVFAGRCALRRTDDGGVTVRRLAWGSSDDSCAAQIQAVSFPSPLIGYLLLTNGDVYATGDGGDNWKKQGVAPGSTAVGGTDRRARHGLHQRQQRRDQRRQPDAAHRLTPASTGRRCKTAAPAPECSTLSSSAAPIGYAVGDHTDMLKTTDSGATWNSVAGDLAPTGQRSAQHQLRQRAQLHRDDRVEQLGASNRRRRCELERGHRDAAEHDQRCRLHRFDASGRSRSRRHACGERRHGRNLVVPQLRRRREIPRNPRRVTDVGPDLRRERRDRAVRQRRRMVDFAGHRHQRDGDRRNVCRARSGFTHSTPGAVLRTRRTPASPGPRATSARRARPKHCLPGSRRALLLVGPKGASTFDAVRTVEPRRSRAQLRGCR